VILIDIRFVRSRPVNFVEEDGMRAATFREPRVPGSPWIFDNALRIDARRCSEHRPELRYVRRVRRMRQILFFTIPRTDRLRKSFLYVRDEKNIQAQRASRAHFVSPRIRSAFRSNPKTSFSRAEYPRD